MSYIININKLNPHPKNKDIYGEEDIKELAEKIKKSGKTFPLIINQNNVIISGHRRYYANLYLGNKEVEVEKVEFKDETEELERLLLENQYRLKSNYQMMKEAEVWEDIEKDKAKRRKESTQFGNAVVSHGTPPINIGKSRDVIAKKVGLGSGQTYERAKPAVKIIDQLKKEGNEKDAEFLTVVLNETARGAKDLANFNSLSKISDELKEQVINGETTVQQAIKEVRKDLGIVTDDMKRIDSAKNKNEIGMKTCSKCGEEKDIENFYSGRAECRECHDANSKYKDVYGKVIKTDKEKLRGVDLNAIEADIKDTNKNVNTNDCISIIMEMQFNINMFVQNMNKYVHMIGSYIDIDKESKTIVLTSIENVETTMNQIKNIIL